MSHKARLAGTAAGCLTAPGYGYWESYLPLFLAQDVQLAKEKEENEP